MSAPSAFSGVADAAKKSAAALATTVVELPGVAADVTKNAVNITKNASQTVDNLSEIAVIASKTSAKPLGETVGNAAEAANEASKSLKTIATTANTLLETTNSLATRVKLTIEDSNKRREDINKENRELREKTSPERLNNLAEQEKIKLIEQTKLNELKSKKKLAEEDAKLEKELRDIDNNRKLNELKARELSVELERQQAIFEAETQSTNEDVYIATHNYGYKDKNLRDNGYNLPKLSLSRGYGVYYKVVQLSKDDLEYTVTFQLPDKTGTEKNVGYFIEDDNRTKYYLNLRNLLREGNDSFFSNSKPFLTGKNILNSNGESLGAENDKYTIILQKRWFKIPRTGGRKTNKKHVKKNKRTRARRNR